MKVSRLPSGLYALHSAYSKTVIAACKEVPGMAWDGGEHAWVGYLDAVALVVDKLRAKGLQVEGALPQAGNFELWMKADYEGLRDYQKRALDFVLMEGRQGCLLADEMGLGKSAVAVKAMKAVGGGLVVCPAYVRGVWHKEVKKWWPEAIVFDFKGTKIIPLDWLASNTVGIINYDVLHAWEPAICGRFPLIVFDEIHNLANDKSRRSQAAKNVSHYGRANGSTWVIGLTGTPLTNKMRNFWNVIDTVSLGRVGKFFPFAKRHCNAHQIQLNYGDEPKVVWNFDGASNEAEICQRMQYFVLRRTKAEVALQLPPKTRQMVYVDVAAKNKSGISPALFGSRAATQAALNLACDGKLNDVVELVTQHTQAGHKVVVFCWRRDVAEMVSTRLTLEGVESRFIHGGVGAARDKILRDAEASSDGGALCATIDSVATGISLTFADVAVFAEITWEPHELLQAEARLDRPGQTRPVLVQYVIAKETAEELVAEQVVEKMELQGSVGLGLDGGLERDLRNEGKEAEVLAGLAAAAAKWQEREEWI